VNSGARSVNAFFQQLAKIGALRLVLMFGVAAGVAATLLTVSMQVNDSDRALLYSGLELRDVSSITEQLDQAGIRYFLEAGGSAVFVSPKDVVSARLLLSAEGLPGSGSIGYELFDRQDALGTTSFVQNVNRVRAMEGEIARTISGLDAVETARVHLALPERRLFERDAAQPKASVWVSLRDDSLSRQHARTIRHAVAFAVPGLTTERVTIFDSEGRLLAGGSTEDGVDGGAQRERQSAIEDEMRRKIVTVLERLVGPGQVTAEVTAQVDFNRVTESAEIFDPEGRALRSSDIVEESNSESDSEGLQDPASVSENIPGGDAATDEVNRQSSIAGNRTQEVQNWEVSKTTRTQVSEVGTVQRISVSVAVDGTLTVGEDGQPVYTPRSDEEMAQIAALVRSAIGFSAERGDTVEVVNMRFARTLPDANGAPAKSAMEFDKSDVMRAIELGILLIVALLIIFFVARPLTKGAIGAVGGSKVDPAALANGVPKVNALPAPGKGKPGDGGAPGDDAVDLIEEGLDIEQFDGQVKMSSIKKVSDVVEKHPDESISIIRNWLHDETKAA
jgi:flagellar M-ring protein FliF